MTKMSVTGLSPLRQPVARTGRGDQGNRRGRNVHRQGLRNPRGAVHRRHPADGYAYGQQPGAQRRTRHEHADRAHAPPHDLAGRDGSPAQQNGGFRQQQEQRQQRRRQSEWRGPGNEPACKAVEEDRLPNRRVQRRGIRQRRESRERVVALLLNAARAGIRRAVERRMVAADIADEGEIETLVRRRLEDGEVGVVRQLLVHDIIK